MTGPIDTSSPLPPQGVGLGTTTVAADRVSDSATAVANDEQASSAETSDPPRVAQAARDINEYIQSVSRSLQISVDDDLGQTVITVLDSETDEIVRQIPAEEILEIARFLSLQQSDVEPPQSLQGVLIDREG
ncbi:MAG: flagellar protein FlaG [Pseudomonadota bacterium]